MRWSGILLLVMVPIVLSNSWSLPERQKTVQTSTDEPAVIRLLAAYTPAARGGSCSAGLIRSQIQHAVQEINQSFINSQVSARLELAGIVEVGYIEMGDEDLVAVMRALQSGSQPFDDLHILRDELAADLVSLVVSSGQTCYASDIMVPISTYFAPYAYTVVRIDCMLNDLALAQAVGKNLGAGMDWYTYQGGLPDDYSNHGFISLDGEWRTIMTDLKRCTDNGIFCDHIPYWSTPNIDYAGMPTGNSDGPTNCEVGVDPPAGVECAANNAATLNQSASTAAAFRHGTAEPWQPPSILLVDDVGTGSAGLDTFYSSALDQLDISYDLCSTGITGLQEPLSAELTPYRTVVWFSGDNAANSAGPGMIAESALASWLGSQNCLLLSSSGYAENHQQLPSALMQDFLGVLSVDGDHPSDRAIGLGPFAGLGEYTLTGPAHFALEPQPGALVAFQGDAGGVALFKMTPGYRTSYFAFPLEVLPSGADRRDVLERFLDTCLFNNTYLPVMMDR